MSRQVRCSSLSEVTQLIGADGSRVEAKTPDGTRINTPGNNAAVPGGAGLTPAGPSGSVTPRTASYAGALKAPATDWHLEFSLNGNKVALADTIYGLVHKNKASLPAGIAAGGPYGTAVTLTWKKVDGPAPGGKR